MNELTPRQAQVLALIRDHIAAAGYPPTRADIARALRFRSANAAEEHLRALARKGVLEISSATSRGIRVLVPDPDASASPAADDDERGLPVIGRVAAGQPILAAEHVEARYAVDATTFRPHADYLLRVRGDSMQGAGILDGDLLAVHRQPRADWGQIVVARVDDDVTVKRLARGRTREELCLVAENPAYAPIRVDLRSQPTVIEGLAVGVLRTSL